MHGSPQGGGVFKTVREKKKKNADGFVRERKAKKKKKPQRRKKNQNGDFRKKQGLVLRKQARGRGKNCHPPIQRRGGQSQ